MPEDYKKVVLDAYNEMKVKGTISPDLLDSTPGSLRNECLNVYRERERNAQDEEILRQFFGPADPVKGHYQILENKSAEEFRQLSRILKGDVPKPGMRFIELIAWLIDFQPRSSTTYYKSFYETKVQSKSEAEDISTRESSNTSPQQKNEPSSDHEKQNEDAETVVKHPQENYAEEINHDTTSSEEKKLKEDGNANDGHLSNTNSDSNKKRESKDEDGIEKDHSKKTKHPVIPFKFLILSSIILLLTVAIFTAGQTDLIDHWTGEKDCMYWNGDKYIKTACNEQPEGSLVVKLDTNRMAHFKRITRPDTLTSADIGRVWRSKKNGKVDFFTASGDDPVDTSMRVLPLTVYMLNKWGKISE